MNLSVAKTRLKEVIEVDSILSKESDFLLTHVPFRKIKVRNGLKIDSLSEYLSEESFFEKYFVDHTNFDSHQFIIVEGSSGTGKSHFIRWINAKLSNCETDVVFLIRRDDNTLKGTIKQLLNVDEIKNLKNKDTYERLVKANKTISDVKFKNQIYYQFVSELDSGSNDGNEDILSNLQKKQLLALMTNERFKQRLLGENGPIERIFHKIVNNGQTNNDLVAEFLVSDFTLDTDFGDLLRSDNADQKARKMADKLIPDDDGNSIASVVVSYLNSLVDDVIQNCAGIEPGDFQQIFREIRQELKKQGKNLILLIEDVTSFTGVNQALLNALVTGHTGMYENEGLCRLISVVGTTSQYYSSFRDNYKDRITVQVTIEDGAIGSKREDLFDFFAKYLNAMSLPSDVGERWVSDGASEQQFPVDKFVDYKGFDYVLVHDNKCSLYPFTKRSIENLYDFMETQKTPRHILREIIEPAINDLLFRKEKFLTFATNKNIHPSKESVDGRIRSVIAAAISDDKERDETTERTLALVALYGSNQYQMDANNIYGVNKSIWNEFALIKIGNLLCEGISIDDTQPIDDTPQEEQEQEKPVREKNKEYDSFLLNLNSWYTKKTLFNNARYIREEINDFVFETLDWQRLGVPFKVAKIAKESTKDLFSFERQDRAESSGLIKLEANEETRQLLICFGKYMYQGKKTWNFKDSASEVFFVTKWLEKYTPRIVEAIYEKDDLKKCPSYVEAAICVDLACKLLSDCDIARLSSIDHTLFLKDFEIKQSSPSHGQKWNAILSSLFQDGTGQKMYDLYMEFFTSDQGGSLNKRVLNYSSFVSSINRLKKSGFELNTEEFTIGSFKAKNEALTLYDSVFNKIKVAIAEEKERAKNWIAKLLDCFGFDAEDEIDDTDINNLLRQIKNFYSDAQKAGFYIQNKEEQIKALLDKSDSLIKAIVNVRKAISTDNMVESMILLNGNSVGLLIELSDVLDSSSTDLASAETQATEEEERLKRSGVWTDNTDPRFEEKEESFNALYKEIMNDDCDL